MASLTEEEKIAKLKRVDSVEEALCNFPESEDIQFLSDATRFKSSSYRSAESAQEIYNKYCFSLFHNIDDNLVQKINSRIEECLKDQTELESTLFDSAVQQVIDKFRTTRTFGQLFHRNSKVIARVGSRKPSLRSIGKLNVVSLSRSSLTMDSVKNVTPSDPSLASQVWLDEPEVVSKWELVNDVPLGLFRHISSSIGEKVQTFMEDFRNPKIVRNIGQLESKVDNIKSDHSLDREGDIVLTLAEIVCWFFSPKFGVVISDKTQHLPCGKLTAWDFLWSTDFYAFLETEFATENINFWREVELFKQRNRDVKESNQDARNRMTEEALTIYKNYLAPDSQTELCVDHAVASELNAIMEKAKEDPSALSLDVFDNAYLSVAHTLKTDSLSRYRVFLKNRRDHASKEKDMRFLGQNGVDWLYTNLSLANRDMAVLLGTVLLSVGALSSQDRDSQVQRYLESEHYIGSFQLWQKCYDLVERLRIVGVYDDTYVEDSGEKGKLEKTILTQRDWSLLLSSATCLTYAADDVIIDEGVFNQCIFRVKSGTVRVEKRFPAKSEDGKATVEKRVVAQLGPGSVFSEMSAVDASMPTSAAIVADSGDVEIYCMQLPFIKQICTWEPTLARNLYRWLASRSAVRLRELSKTTPALAGPSSPTGPAAVAVAATAAPRRSVTFNDAAGTKPAIRIEVEEDDNLHTTSQTSDQKLFSLFKIENEVILREYECFTTHHMMKCHGILYISYHYICFSARIFGSSKKSVIPVEAVTNVEVKKKDILAITHGKKKSVQFQFMKRSDLVLSAQELIQQMMDKVAEKGGGAAVSVQQSVAFSIPPPITRGSRDGGGGGVAPLPSMVLNSVSPFTSPRNSICLSPSSMVMDGMAWGLVLRKARSVSFSKGEYIIRQGQYSQQLYQIAAGTCKIIQEVAQAATQAVQVKPRTILLRLLQEGDVFGEVSLLEDSASTSASVIANSNVTVYVIDADALNQLFVQRPGLAGMFFQYLTSVIVGRFRSNEMKILG